MKSHLRLATKGGKGDGRNNRNQLQPSPKGGTDLMTHDGKQKADQPDNIT